MFRPEKLKQAREHAGFTKLELARITGLTQNTLVRYEKSDVSEPKYSNLVKIANALGVAVSSFYDQPDVEQKQIEGNEDMIQALLQAIEGVQVDDVASLLVMWAALPAATQELIGDLIAVAAWQQNRKEDKVRRLIPPYAEADMRKAMAELSKARVLGRVAVPVEDAGQEVG